MEIIIWLIILDGKLSRPYEIAVHNPKCAFHTVISKDTFSELTVEKRKVLHPTVGTTAKNAKSLFGEGEQFISNVNCFFYLLP